MNDNTIFEIRKKAAQVGDPEAQVMLIMPQIQGQRSLKKRKAQIEDTLKWLNLASEQDYGPAIAMLGAFYLDGDRFGKYFPSDPEIRTGAFKEGRLPRSGTSVYEARPLLL
ncbi:MAG: hypothetical protein H6856_02095 [Rhodospirillales bacterium]|nr:hypothetical protein [Rhodospirillales bacterium]